MRIRATTSHYETHLIILNSFGSLHSPLHNLAYFARRSFGRILDSADANDNDLRRKICAYGVGRGMLDMGREAKGEGKFSLVTELVSRALAILDGDGVFDDVASCGIEWSSALKVIGDLCVLGDCVSSVSTNVSNNNNRAEKYYEKVIHNAVNLREEGEVSERSGAERSEAKRSQP